MFYTFNQNNSGGSFDFSESDGITHIVIIEAKDADEANRLAIMKGLYFDGCSRGEDCSCCGDRWNPVEDGKYGEGSESPEVYGKSPAQYVKDGRFLWMEKGKEVAVHHKTGTVNWY